MIKITGKFLIFALVMLALSGICNGQGVTNFGATVPNNFSKTGGKMWWTAYGGLDTVVLIANDSGVVKAVPIAVFRTLIDSGTFVHYSDTPAMLAPYLREYDPSAAQTVGSLLAADDVQFNSQVFIPNIDADESNILVVNGGGNVKRSAISSADLVTNDTLHNIFLPRFYGDTLRVNGDSYAACTGISPNDSCFTYMLSNQLGIPLVTYATGGQGIRYSALQTYLYKPRDRGLNIINAGLNDAYFSNVNNYNLTTLYNYWGNYLNLYLAGCFEDTVSSCQSAYFTKNGTITTNSNASSRSVSLGSTVTVMNVAGDYVEFTTADSGIIIHYFKSTRAQYGSIRVSVAGSTVDTLVPQNEAWAVDLYSTDSIFPTAQYYSLKGYGIGSKTVRMTALAGGGATQWWIDAVGFPKTDANKRGVVLMESAQIPLAANNYDNVDRVFATNAARRNYIAKYWQGFPIRIVKQPLNLQSDFSNDGVHPNNRGNRVYDTAFLKQINTSVNSNVYFQDYNPSGGAITSLTGTQTAGSFSATVVGSTGIINNPLATSTTPGLIAFGNQDMPGGVKRFTDNIQIATLSTTGGVLFTSSTQTVTQDGTGFIYDATNDRLSLGKTAPTVMLDIKKDQNAGTTINLENLTAGTASGTGVIFTSGVAQNNANIFKRTSLNTNYKTLGASDLQIYNFISSGSSNIQILNDHANGAIGLTAGGASTAHLFIASGGNVGIGQTSIDASAKLEVNSTTQGVLFPRMTAAQGSAIGSPANGLVIYVTDTNGTFTSVGFWGREAGAWVKL